MAKDEELARERAGNDRIIYELRGLTKYVAVTQRSVITAATGIATGRIFGSTVKEYPVSTVNISVREGLLGIDVEFMAHGIQHTVVSSLRSENIVGFSKNAEVRANIKRLMEVVSKLQN